MSIKIVSDSSCEIWNLEGIDFATVPLTISTDERSFVDDASMDVHEMLDYLARYKDRSYTACPSIVQWIDAFDDADEIYVITLTSGLSGTYNSAMTAREQYLEGHPNAKVYVIDTLSTSTEMILIMEKIVELKSAGASFEEVCEKIAAYKKTTRLFFAFQSIHNLAQNGRVPKIVAQAIGVLGISIIGTASEQGTIESLAKIKGKKRVIANLIQQMKNAGYQGGKAYIRHIENPTLADDFVAALKKEYPNAKVEIYQSRGLVAYYAERGGLIIGCEC